MLLAYHCACLPFCLFVILWSRSSWVRNLVFEYGVCHGFLSCRNEPSHMNFMNFILWGNNFFFLLSSPFCLIFLEQPEVFHIYLPSVSFDLAEVCPLLVLPTFFYFSAHHTEAGLHLSHVDNFCISVLVNENKPEVLTELT